MAVSILLPCLDFSKDFVLLCSALHYTDLLWIAVCEVWPARVLGTGCSARNFNFVGRRALLLQMGLCVGSGLRGSSEQASVHEA